MAPGHVLPRGSVTPAGRLEAAVSPPAGSGTCPPRWLAGAARLSLPRSVTFPPLPVAAWGPQVWEARWLLTERVFLVRKRGFLTPLSPWGPGLTSARGCGGHMAGPRRGRWQLSPASWPRDTARPRHPGGRVPQKRLKWNPQSVGRGSIHRF